MQSREFGFTMAIVVLTLCGFIAALGLSAPLLTGLGVKLHLADFQGAVREDYHNKALFPIAVLLALGMGIGPHLAWRGKGGPDSGETGLELCPVGGRRRSALCWRASIWERR